MKKLLFVVVALAVLSLALPARAQLIYAPPGSPGTQITAEVMQPSGTTDTGALRVASKSSSLWSQTGIAGTTAITSPDIDTSKVDEVVVALFNGNTTVARLVTVVLKGMGAALTVTTADSCAANTTCFYVYAVGATATGVKIGYSIPPPPTMQVSTNAPAGGAGNSTIAVWGR